MYCLNRRFISTREGDMLKDIDKLLKLHEYDIYNNVSINPDKLLTTKFCWLNPILIINKIEYPQKLKCLPWLFGLLKDVMDCQQFSRQLF